MRSAIRGDFERLAERRGGQELMRPADEDTERPVPGPQEDVAPEVAPEAVPETAVEPEAEPEPEPEPTVTEPDAEPVVARDTEPESPVEPDLGAMTEDGEEPMTDAPRRRSWLDRLLGR
jgi:hypothetical protein